MSAFQSNSRRVNVVSPCQRRTGWIYLLRVGSTSIGSTDLYKVGLSFNVANRIGCLSASNCETYSHIISVEIAAQKLHQAERLIHNWMKSEGWHHPRWHYNGGTEFYRCTTHSARVVTATLIELARSMMEDRATAERWTVQRYGQNSDDSVRACVTAAPQIRWYWPP
jgi:hypothetical protein